MVLMSDENVLVSVVIPTYKRPINLQRAINSVLAQNYRNIEILIVDDNDAETKDRKETELFMRSYKQYSNISYIKHAKNLNGAAARNTGIKNSKGRLIAFLDDDDEWDESKITKQVEYLLKNPDYNACYCCSTKYRNGLAYYDSNYKKNGRLSADLLSLKSEVYTPSLIFWKEALLEINGFDESFVRHQDFELLIKYFRKFEIICLPEHLVRVHVDDASNHLSFDKFEFMKLRFLKIFEEDINRLNLSDKKNIYKEHYFELFYYALMKRNLIKSIKYIIKSKPGLIFIWGKKSKFYALIKKISKS